MRVRNTCLSGPLGRKLYPAPYRSSARSCLRKFIFPLKFSRFISGVLAAECHATTTIPSRAPIITSEIIARKTHKTYTYNENYLSKIRNVCGWRVF